MHDFVLCSVYWNQVHTGHFGHTGEHFVSADEECKNILTGPLLCCGSTVVRCCATNRKVAGSIPAGVSGFFIDTKSF